MTKESVFKKVFSTKINVVANFAASIWVAFLSIVFVPLYLKYIGIEAYGLIGVFSSIQLFVSLLDFGISPTINRELARLSAIPDSAQEMHDLKRTLEIPNWISAAIVALLLAGIAPLAARYWVQPNELSITTVTEALIIISINSAIQFSSNFYLGGLMGMQRQLIFNLIIIICGTIRALGSIFILLYVSPSIQAFLIWQGLIGAVQAGLFVILLNKSLPVSAEKGNFRKDLLKQVWKFAAGMTGIGVVALILTQMDKIILSRMLDLKTFGFYSLAITISSMAISIPAGAVAHSVYPNLSRLAAAGDDSALSDYYHRYCQILSIVLIPIAFVLAAFSYQILMLWTGNPEIAGNTYLLLTCLSIGTCLNCLMWLPYYLQLAHGKTNLAFYMNLVLIGILIPIMIYGVINYGALGGAATWIVLNIVYILAAVPIMHRTILKGEQWKWYFQDVLLIALLNSMVVAASFIFYPSESSKFVAVLWLGTTWLICLSIPALIYKNTRRLIFTTFNIWRKYSFA